MLGDNIGSVGWPKCGEIDIMESVNVAIGAHGSLHAPNWGATATYTPPGMVTLGAEFHTYTTEWDAQSISFFVDGTLYETQTPSDATSRGGAWVFDNRFYHFQLRRRRQLARQSELDQRLPADDESRLGARILEELRSPPP